MLTALEVLWDTLAQHPFAKTRLLCVPQRLALVTSSGWPFDPHNSLPQHTHTADLESVPCCPEHGGLPSVAVDGREHSITKVLCLPKGS